MNEKFIFEIIVTKKKLNATALMADLVGVEVVYILASNKEKPWTVVHEFQNRKNSRECLSKN